MPETPEQLIAEITRAFETAVRLDLPTSEFVARVRQALLDAQPPSDASVEGSTTAEIDGELLAALKEVIAAGDYCVEALDDVEAMLRFGKAHDVARAAIAHAEAPSDSERLQSHVHLCGPEQEEKSGQHADAININGELLAAAKLALVEMCNTVAPRDSFTDAVDALDEAIWHAEAHEGSRGET